MFWFSNLNYESDKHAANWNKSIMKHYFNDERHFTFFEFQMRLRMNQGVFTIDHKYLLNGSHRYKWVFAYLIQFCYWFKLKNMSASMFRSFLFRFFLQKIERIGKSSQMLIIMQVYFWGTFFLSIFYCTLLQMTSLIYWCVIIIWLSDKHCKKIKLNWFLYMWKGNI